MAAEVMASLSKSGRRRVDGGLLAPQSCRLVPPFTALYAGVGRAHGWLAHCLLRCHDTQERKTREQAIEAHREHVEKEHADEM